MAHLRRRARYPLRARSQRWALPIQERRSRLSVVTAGPQTIPIDPAVITWTGVDPTITGGNLSIPIDTAVVTWTGVQPTLTASGSATQAIDPAVVTWTGVQPTATTLNYYVNDDFSGSSIDTSKWDVYDRIGDEFNGEVNSVIPANVRVSGGSLLIDSKYVPGGVTASDTDTAPTTVFYTSGQIAQKSAPFLYGTVEVRAKIPGGTGPWPCIWMLGHEWQASQPFNANTPGQNWPHDGWNEIDIAEFGGGFDRSHISCQNHFESASNSGSGYFALGFDSTTQFAVYRFEWTPTTITWSVDPEDGGGFNVLSTYTGTAGVDIPDEPMYLVIHTAVGGSFGGTVNSATFPVTMEVDYARVTLSPLSPLPDLPIDPAVITWTGVQPTLAGVTVSQPIDPAVITWTGVQPTLVPSALTIPIDPAVITWAGVQPTLTVSGSATQAIDPAVITWEAVNPSISGSQIVSTIDPAVITWVGVDPTVAGAGTVSQTVDPAVLTWTGVQPSLVADPVTVPITPAVVTWTGVDPTVAGAGTVTVTIDTAVIVWTGVDPAVALGQGAIAIDPGVITWVGVDPTVSVSGSATIPVDPAVITWEAVTPTISGSQIVVTIDPAVLTFVAVDPTLTPQPVTILVDPGVLTFTGVDPVITNIPGVIPIDSATLTWTGVQPTLTGVGLGATIQIDTAILVWAGGEVVATITAPIIFTVPEMVGWSSLEMLVGWDTHTLI